MHGVSLEMFQMGGRRTKSVEGETAQITFLLEIFTTHMLCSLKKKKLLLILNETAPVRQSTLFIHIN